MGFSPSFFFPPISFLYSPSSIVSTRNLEEDGGSSSSPFFLGGIFFSFSSFLFNNGGRG